MCRKHGLSLPEIEPGFRRSAAALPYLLQRSINPRFSAIERTEAGTPRSTGTSGTDRAGTLACGKAMMAYREGVTGMTQRPVLASTMGDPAGIGPEICVRALLSPDVRDVSRGFVIGDARVLSRALEVCGLPATFNRITAPEDIADRPGVIDVLHQDSADPAVLRMGEVQPLGGEAAYAAIRASIDLAMSHRIDGVVTAPINKESLQAARIPFIGHTEMFAEHTGAREEMTMFTISGLKIFFLTRHVSLRKACELITEPRVSKGIDNCVKALRQLGYDQPHLAVAALNPHGGEDGMFGREEIEAIKPAIASARARGMQISGPVPADSVFHFARIGRYDAVLSLYHDQGHIAAKMMDFEKTVSVTLGLPILRTSVDHGTAFDIAGTGKASAVSMIEAIRVAADYVVRGVRLGDEPEAKAAE
jgi:4-phospho-D-threonate 3-dehydrogenase / 4-phospho-D-erythronate 3-dehydrogenase